MADKKTIRDGVKELKKSGVDIRRLGDGTIDEDVESIPSSSLSLDYAMGVGGYPKGRLIEIFGPESGGKSTISYLAIASCQELGGTAALIDIENSFEPSWGRSLGINVEDLYVAQPEYAEKVFDVILKLIEVEVDLIVVDSTAALVPKSELEGDMEKNSMALVARIMSKGCRKVNAVLTNKKTIIIFINQIREKVGTIWGNPEVTTGGKALKFYSAIRIRVARLTKSQRFNSDKEAIGHGVAFKIVKNKVAAPFKNGDFYLSYKKGIKRSLEVFELGVKFEIIEVDGRIYTYKKYKWNGQEQCKTELRKNRKLREELSESIRKKF